LGRTNSRPAGTFAGEIACFLADLKMAAEQVKSALNLPPHKKLARLATKTGFKLASPSGQQGG
jgi:hypothetical protein